MQRPFKLVVVFLLVGSLAAARGENWTEFRGPTGQGIYSGKDLPIEWSPTKNVAWKTPIPGKGWSSPIVFEGRVYLTSAVPSNQPEVLSLQAICLDATTGKLLWQAEVFEHDGAKAPRIHRKNGHASPSPTTDGKRLYVHFGHEGTAALDFDGKVLWRNTEHRYEPVHGNGGTPVLVGDHLIFSADGSDSQSVIALNTADGTTAWKSDRKSVATKKFSFSTPLAIDVNGQTQIISPASDVVAAYAPADGKELWRVKYTGYSVIPRPVYGHGMVFLSSGYDRPMALAIRVDGTGDVTDSNVVWTETKKAPHTPSMLLVGDELYMVADDGTGACLDAHTGKENWRKRIRGAFSASPVYGDGKIYFQNEAGVTSVVRAGKEFELLATNDMEEVTFASPAIADHAIYLRTETQLYRLQNQ